MVHLGRTRAALMLDVTAAAVLNVRMEGSRLFGKVNCGRGMARNAGRRFDPSDGSMARFTLVAEEGVLSGNWSRLEEAAPAWN